MASNYVRNGRALMDLGTPVTLRARRIGDRETNGLQSTGSQSQDNRPGRKQKQKQPRKDGVHPKSR